MKSGIRASASRESSGWQYFVEILGGRAESAVLVDGPASKKGAYLIVLTHLAIGDSERELLDNPNFGITKQRLGSAKSHFGAQYGTLARRALLYESVKAGDLRIVRGISPEQLPDLGPDSLKLLKYWGGDPRVYVPREDVEGYAEQAAQELGVPNRPGLLGSIAVLAGLTDVPIPPAAGQSSS